MRLLNTTTQAFGEFFEENVPHYAIISHRWEGEEVSFKDAKKKNFYTDSGRLRSGAQKILDSCSMAHSRNVNWVWIDTCCIDKRSSAELSEAINSMYRWYQNSTECYVYLSDVKWDKSSDSLLRASEKIFATSQWFSRGWTLQELLAPRSLYFFDRNWTQIGTRRDLQVNISTITGIENESLLKDDVDGSFINSPKAEHCERRTDCSFHARNPNPSIATKMSWASKRQTTRIEDMAYCLLGIFDINMPLLYGEGIHAFKRLQSEITKKSDDESIFAFDGYLFMPTSKSYFADSPRSFLQSQCILYGRTSPLFYYTKRPVYVETNRGLELPITWRSSIRKSEYATYIRIPLDCKQCSANGPRNVILNLQLIEPNSGEEDNLEVSHQGFDTAKDSEIFYQPSEASNEHQSWRPSRRIKFHEGDLSAILGHLGKVTRLLVV